MEANILKQAQWNNILLLFGRHVPIPAYKGRRRGRDQERGSNFRIPADIYLYTTLNLLKYLIFNFCKYWH